MQFTGLNTVFLPQKSGFSFAISNIDLTNATGITNFYFSDTNNNQINFQFSGGYILLNKIISTYDSTDLININGYYQNNILNYQIDGIFGQQDYTFGALNTFTVSGDSNPLFCDIIVDSTPINYNVAFLPYYNAGGQLTGIVTTDTNFFINSTYFHFLDVNNYVPMVNTGFSLNITNGTGHIILQDLDVSLIEYLNTFNATINAPFSNIGGIYSSYREDVYGQNIVNVIDFDSNVYYLQSLFNGIWQGNTFIYQDNPLTYNISYLLQTINMGGYETPTSFSAQFQPLYPLNNSGYVADYITGFTLTHSGSYSGQPPAPIFTQYYYVTGINQQFQNMLFSTGCGSGINLSFLGPASGTGSGFLNMASVNISGIYGNGINSFNIVEGYIPLSSGSGYTTVPLISWGTGNNCYSVPDKSGYNYAQFQKISGLRGATLDQVAGMTGIVLTSGINGTGYVITGLQMTNIGFGYGSTYPPLINFQRWTGDPLTNNASGILNYKTTGLYNFTGFWDISYNFQNSNNIYLTGYGPYYSGNITMPSGQNIINFQIALTGLDNTNPISGLLTLSIPTQTGVITDTKNIIQSRYYNLNTGALYNNLPTIISFVPVPNLNYLFSGNQNGSQYQEDFNNL